MAIDMRKLHNKKNTIKPITWKRDASRRVIKGSTIASWKILNFVHPSSNMIEMKKYQNGRSCGQGFLSLHDGIRIFSIQNRIGGSLSISLETLDHWEIVLTSTKHCLHQAVHQESGERQLRPMPLWKYQQRHQSSSSSSTWWQWSDSWWSS